MDNNLDTFHTEIIPESAGTAQGRSKTMRMVIDILETLVLSLILFAGINLVSARIRVDGYSMEPTLHSGEFVIVNKLAYKFAEVRVGDVIVFHFPRDPDQEYIKRVIGLPGDRVVISNGQVWINDRLLDEPYITSQPAYEATWIVPADSLFVLGDNRNNSSDSHSWGPVPIAYVIGKAVFVYWPPTNWGLIDHTNAAIAAP